MKSFDKRYVMISLLVLTHHFVALLARNVTYEQKANIAKVSTSFLKVPWINLNSSWTDAVASTCRNDVSTLFESADRGEMWALQMLDAASKVPSGILIGNIWDFGMFDECIKVTSHTNPAKIQGQHCMISLSIPTKFFENTSKMIVVQKLSFYKPIGDMEFSLSISVCLPSSCNIQDINGLVKASIKSMPELSAFEVSVVAVRCSSSEFLNEFTWGSILTLLFFAMLIIFLLFCTACDFVLRARSDVESLALKNLAKFSLYTNLLILTSTELSSDAMPAVNGFRFINTCLIVFGHRCFSNHFKPSVNLSDLNEWLHSKLASFLFSLFYVNETFFLISGFLIAYSSLKKLRSGAKLNVLTTYLHRYLRFTPSLAAVILFVIFILPYLGSGPIWKNVSDQTIALCQENWWTNLLYIQNMVNAEQMCLMHTWFLAVEMQLFWLTPLILYPLYHWPKIGPGILGLLLTASFLVPAVQIMLNHWSSIIAIQKSTPEAVSEFFLLYTITRYRALAFLIGILLGYDVVFNKRQLSKLQVTVNWILASLFVIFSYWIVLHIQPISPTYDVVWEAIYISFGRLSWSFAMAWIIYACTQGYGGAITNFLSLPIFVPLSRLSYGIYLVHIILQVTTNSVQRTADFMTPFTSLYLAWGDLALSSVMASILVLCIESPVTTLEKILTSNRTSSSTHISGAVSEHTDKRLKRFERHCKKA